MRAIAMTNLRLLQTVAILFVVACGATAHAAASEAPHTSDPRLEVVCFAEAPEIRHPINLDFDRQGRLLVIESHTHFRPANYEGPEHDRVLAMEDTDGDGRADRFRTFFEGTKFTMDLALHHDGSVYIATRSEILRLEDENRDGVADRPQQIVRLETKGDYPHNGLSGLAFDFDGNLVFGLGENSGVSYRLVGADGVTLADEGEGGNLFRCTKYGKQLCRFATGFWNPFGVTIDIFGRTWAVDNDPDAMPPCRLLHVVEGGDFGYQFRYGRSGRHPFQAWNGQLPGTLPMAAGTGEAPCEVLSYESDGLPEEYLGNLLVTSWADHRVERYALKPRGASYEAERQPFIQGGSEFRPVGLAMAPDGSLFVSDWVRSDYNLHNQGAIWHIRPREPVERSNARDPAQPLAIKHRPTREAVARHLRNLHKSPVRLLCDQLHHDDLRVRATAVAIVVPACYDEARKLIVTDPDNALRACAVQKLVAFGQPAEVWLDADQPPAVRLAAVASLRRPADASRLVELLDEDDPFMRSAAVRQLSQLPRPIVGIDVAKLSPRARMGVLLAERAAAPDDADAVKRWLDDPDEELRFLAVKWIADRRLTSLRPRVAQALDDGNLSARLYQAYATALGRIDGEEVSEAKMAEHFASLAADDHQPAARRVTALRLVPANNEQLTIELLRRLVRDNDESLPVDRSAAPRSLTFRVTVSITGLYHTQVGQSAAVRSFNPRKTSGLSAPAYQARRGWRSAATR
jgi:putative membrane-bound dehydrogenase-like protein